MVTPQYYPLVPVLQELGLLLLVCGVCVSEILTDTFFLKPTCDLDSGLASGCVDSSHGFRSLTDCSAICLRDTLCTGCVQSASGELLLHRNCTPMTSCNIAGSELPYWERWRYCLNGGVWDSLMHVCRCVGGWVDHSCQRLSENCSELVRYHYPTRNTYHVTMKMPQSSVTYPVLCYISDVGTSTLLFRNKGKFLTTNRTYQDYKTGFVLDNNNFWMGLDNWARVLELLQPSKVVLSYTFKDDDLGTNGTVKYRYNGFRLMSESEGYSFFFDSFDVVVEGNPEVGVTAGDGSPGKVPGDCMTPLQGVWFSTWDRDQDDDLEQNCASLSGTGWWLGSCEEECVLFAPLHDPDLSTYDSSSPMRIPGLDPLDYAGSLKGISLIIWTPYP